MIPFYGSFFFTGVTKFTKTGVFSALNNLVDLSTNSDYAQMFGYSQQELELFFVDYLDQAQSKLAIPRKQLLEKIQVHYKGFSFDGLHFLYNPFSILCFFLESQWKNFWLHSGSPSFLVEYARQHRIQPEEFLHTYVSESSLSAFEIESASPVSFLLQAGYLTFKRKDPEKGYQVDYPNKEVRDSFSELLLLGTYDQSLLSTQEFRSRIIDGFRQKDFSVVFGEMQRLFASIPYMLFEKQKKGEDPNQWTHREESFYHSLFRTALWACGISVKAEEPTHLGRSDLIIEFAQDVYIVELKKAPAQKALSQILQKEYHLKYTDRPLSLIGIEIDANRRNLAGFTISQA